MKKLSSSVIVLAFLCSTMLAYGHGAATEAIAGGPTGTLPNSIFYGLDLMFEKIGDVFSFSAKAKLGRMIAHADERIREYSILAPQGELVHAAKALAAYKPVIARAASLIAQIDTEQDVRITELSTKIMAYREILATTYGETGEDAHEAIVAALDASDAAHTDAVANASEEQRSQITEIKELYDREVNNYLNPQVIPPPPAPIPPQLTTPPPALVPTPEKPITEIPAAPCIKTGCSGQVCSDEEVMTTCEFRAEYECYRTAKCERQATGQCGWTPTTELQACLGQPR
jgi:hypothetical protein